MRVKNKSCELEQKGRENELAGYHYSMLSSGCGNINFVRLLFVVA